MTVPNKINGCVNQKNSIEVLKLFNNVLKTINNYGGQNHRQTIDLTLLLYN